MDFGEVEGYWAYRCRTWGGRTVLAARWLGNAIVRASVWVAPYLWAFVLGVGAVLWWIGQRIGDAIVWLYENIPWWKIFKAVLWVLGTAILLIVMGFIKAFFMALSGGRR